MLLKTVYFSALHSVTATPSYTSGSSVNQSGLSQPSEVIDK